MNHRQYPPYPQNNSHCHSQYNSQYRPQHGSQYNTPYDSQYSPQSSSQYSLPYSPQSSPQYHSQCDPQSAINSTTDEFVQQILQLDPTDPTNFMKIAEVNEKLLKSLEI